MGIMVLTGTACDMKETQISHILQSIGVSENYSKGTIEVSFVKYNTIFNNKEISNGK